MKRFFTLILLSFLFAGITTAQKNLSILMVIDSYSGSVYQTDSVRHFLNATGYSYSEYDILTHGTAPAKEDLAPYELVIWLTGNNQLPALWDGDVITSGLQDYITNGGMVVLEGIDFLKKYGSAYTAKNADGDSIIHTFAAGSFEYDNLGIEDFIADAKRTNGGVDGGLPMMVAAADNGICTTDTVKWRWSTMYYPDAVKPKSTAKSIYNMGPSYYAFAGKSTLVYNETANSKILTALVRLDGFKNYATGVEVFTQILDYFNQFSTGNKVSIASLEITSTTGFAISENNGTIQLGVTVLPDDATNKTITWSIKEGSVTATLTNDGLLTASGLDNGNGNVTVVATANDGSEITDEAEITISNQTLGEGYKVLLVNDDARDLTKYKNIDTALIAGQYTYKMYNAAAMGNMPDLDYLSNFDFVIWYNARDGLNLKFWDVSDSSDIKCNSALLQYADNGGVVWVQGRDLLYDIWGSKYTTTAASGDSAIATYQTGGFVNDYLGIKTYLAQTYTNDGSAGVAQLDITEANDISTIDPIKWATSTYSFADVLEVTDTATPLYYLGPATYDFSLYYAMVYNKKGEAQFLTSVFDPSEMDNQENLNQYVKQVIDYFKDNNTGIFNNVQNDFKAKIYPNPAQQMINIEYSSAKYEQIAVRVIDLAGKTLISQNINSFVGNNTKQLDVSRLANGVYNVSINSQSGRFNQRIIIIK
jgi:hypothetical protein